MGVMLVLHGAGLSAGRLFRAALPAGGELTFDGFSAARAAPGFAAVDARHCAFEEILQQLVGLGEARVIDDPHSAHVHRQLPPAAGEEITADDGVDAVRFEQTAYEMSLGHVTGVVHAFHEARVCQALRGSNRL